MPDYYDSEFLSRDDIRALQSAALPGAIARAKRSPFYARALAGCEPDQIRSPEDLRRLPFTTKDDVRSAMPWGMLAVPKEEAVRLHCSSGTTGVAIAIFHTRQDVQWWAECVARGMRGVGVTASDVFQNMMSYGLFTGGLGFHYAAELVGCLTIPASAGNTQRQVELMRDFGTTVLHILPSYALRVARFCHQSGLDPVTDLRLERIFIGAEPHTESLRRRIEAELGCRAYNCYGLSEMGGPGVALECPQQDGLHLREDHYLAEVVDPQTLQPLPPGQPGELVLTTLNRQANPLIRYRTRDLTTLTDQPCPCGRAHRRMARVAGRTDDMFVCRGCNIYPQQVERVLMEVAEVGTNYLVSLEVEDDLDQMTVAVELAPGGLPDDMRLLEDLRRRISEALRHETLVTPRVELLEPGALPPAEGKAVRVVDKRRE